jgi:NADPH2:quinone reductase
VIVDVAAAGLNFPDVLCVQGLYQFKPETPFAPGQEGAGVVAEVGEGVTHLQPGDRVAFVHLSGAIAEKALVPANMCIPVPDGMDLETAAAFSMVYGTSIYALKQRAKLQAGETLLVLGAAGGVGLAAVELGKAMGATVIAAASSAEKLEACAAAGADQLINYAEEDLKTRAKELTGGNGVDVVYDPVGGPYSEPALRALAWEGRHLVVGFAAGEIPKIPLNLTLLKSCQIVGVFWGAWTMRDPKGAAANFAELHAMFEAGKLKPVVSETYDLDHAVDGLRALAERRAVGKLVVTLGGA